MRDIIIFGPCGAGKTTLAEIIEHELVINKDTLVTRASLGAPIKRDCRKYGRNDREAYQKYGQFMRELINKDIWCNIANVEIKSDGVVGIEAVGIIDDGRQLNEFEYFKNEGYLTIGIIADTETRVKRIFERDGVMTTREQLQHETEIQAKECFAKCDIRIYNKGSLEELREQARKIIEELKDRNNG